MTERLYYSDSYLKEFRARVVERGEGGCRIYLSRTAFYPASGGQPSDTGWIGGAPVTEGVDEGERIAHLTTAPVEDEEVECRIDWPRRFDHMQQHSGQHILSAVLVEMYAIPTLGFHLGKESSTIDAGTAALEPLQVRALEARANEIVFENRPVSMSLERSSEDLRLRKASEREGDLRVITIERLDRSACGGTHVRSTGEIGPVFIRKLDKIRGNARIEFVCGGRAVRAAREEYEALSEIARILSASWGETPGLVAAQLARLQECEKARRRMATELAQMRGRELYHTAAPGPGGCRRHVRRIATGAIDEELRAEAQSFSSGAKAIYLALIESPPALLLAASVDAGIHAGEMLKAALASKGGRGGGNAQIAQGSLPSTEALRQLWAELEGRL